MPNFPDNKWKEVNTFNGFVTRIDPQKIKDGDCPFGYNTSIGFGDRFGIREFGYEDFGDLSSYATNKPIKGIHTFRRRDGSNVMMVGFDTFMVYYNTLSERFESLKSSYTTGYKWGFADYNINTEVHSYVYFGNSIDNAQKWNGAYTKLTSAVAPTDATIAVSSTVGFEASGSISIDGTEIAYASVTANSFVLSGTAGITIANGRGVAQAVATHTTAPKGNIYLVANNRLFIAGITATPQAVYVSKYGDANTFTDAALVDSSTATDPCIFNLGEGGGGVIDMILDEEAIYIFKQSIIYKATLSDSLYSLSSLKPFDGKSQTIGSIGKSVFVGSNKVFLVTPDRQFLQLGRVEYIDYPQETNIGDLIKPTINTGKYDEATGIVYRNNAFYVGKSTDTSNYNDVVYVWNIYRSSWDTPVYGWNVNGFTIYNNGSFDELYFGDSVDTRIRKVISEPTDGDYDVKALHRTKQLDFGMPYGLKQMDNIFIEGHIKANTTLNFKLYLDDNGFTQTYSTSISGSDTSYLFSNINLNTLGTNPFGVQVFGSGDDSDEFMKFRVYLNKDVVFPPFYNIQLEFSSEGQNQQWDVINMAFKVGEFTQKEKTSLYHSFRA